MSEPTEDTEPDELRTAPGWGRDLNRRAFVGAAVAASLASVAGCAGGGSGPGVETTAAGGEPAAGDEELPEGVSEEEFVSGPVPEAYRTATAQGGGSRNPDDLLTKADAQFQEAQAAVEAGMITEGPNCGNCTHFIPDQNGDAFGACTRVEGYIDAADWCSIWSPLDGG